MHQAVFNKLKKWISENASFYVLLSFYKLIENTSEILGTYINDCMFLSCHVRVSQWIHTL